MREMAEKIGNEFYLYLETEASAYLVQLALGIDHRKRKITEDGVGFCIKETEAAYNSDFGSKNIGLSLENGWFWKETNAISIS